MSMMEVFNDPAFEPYWYVGLFLFVLAISADLCATLIIKFVRYIKRRFKRKDGDQDE